MFCIQVLYNTHNFIYRIENNLQSMAHSCHLNNISTGLSSFIVITMEQCDTVNHTILRLGQFGCPYDFVRVLFFILQDIQVFYSWLWFFNLLHTCSFFLITH